LHLGAAAVNLTPQVRLTQQDIRNVQLGKAAIAAGIQVLLEAWGREAADVSELLVAGGFGRHLDLLAAVRLGLIPQALAGRCKAVGNSALEGATMLLTSEDAHVRATRIAAAANYIELSSNTRFQELFLANLGF